MIRFLVRFLAVIGLVVVLLVVAGGVAVYHLLQQREPVPSAIVLEYTLDQELVEYAPRVPLAKAMLGHDASLRDIVDALDRGRSDPRVKGAVFRFGTDQVGIGQAQELRAAVERFRRSGRFALAFADTFGEIDQGNRSYYLASGFDEVWLQPVGMVGLTGLIAQVPFAGDALGKFELKLQFGRREQYKTAMDSLSETGFTEANREMTEALVEELLKQLVAGIAEGRRMAPDELRALVDRGPFLDREAVAARLVDRLGYYDELRAEALKRAGADGAGTVDLLDYLDRAGPPHAEGPTVAVIYGTGLIQRGEGRLNPLLGRSVMASTEMVEAFDGAIKDPKVRAILFRIDSGGGSAVASESIRRAVVRAKAAGKPVVVSMGDAAASGGYWIAMNADRIVALPGTLTGSIGVLAGKVVTQDFFEELGVNWETVERGRNAGMFSSVRPFSDTGRARLDAMLDDIYATFLRNVAEARRMPLAGVREVAKGRVWTGSQAQALGLVDDLGDMDVALRRVREVIQLAPDAPVTVRVFPRSRSPFEEVLHVATGRAQAEGAVIEALRPVLSGLAPLVPGLGAGVARMPETGLSPLR